MMHKTHYVTIIIIIGALTAGFLFYGYYHEWIIIRIPTINTQQYQAPITEIIKKKVTYYYWHHDRWNHEESELIWSNNMGDTLELLLNSLMAIMDEEEITEKRITIESAIMSPENDLVYISFNRYPFDMEKSTFKKTMFIESILKTIRHNTIPIKSARFLVHHEPLTDYHLDFSNPWPITGFVNN